MIEKKSVLRTSRLRRLMGAISVLALCMLVSSCTTKAVKRQQSIMKTFDKGDYHAAIDEVRSGKKKLYGETNAFLYYMDMGILFHYAGMYDSSNVNLQKAVQIYDDLFAKSVTNEAAAILTNDNVRPYRARPYELVFMHQIAALNFMAMGMFDEALVEARRVQLHFNEWERKGAKDKKYHSDGMFHLLSSVAYERAGEADNSLISLIKAVEAYQNGPVKMPPVVRGFAYDRLNADGREDDVTRLGIKEHAGSDKWSAKMGEAEIVIVGYAGKGPTLAEASWSGTYISGGLLVLNVSKKDATGVKSNTITLPAPALPPSSGNPLGVTHIKVSLPKVSETPSRTTHFSARTGGKDYRSVTVNNIDEQLRKAIDDEWNDIILRTVVRVVTRTIAKQQTKKALSTDNGLANVLVGIGAEIAASQMEKADTRLCFMLPQTVQVIRIPVKPGKHTVMLKTHDRAGNVIEEKAFQDIVVKKGDKKVLLHSSMR